MSSEEIRKRLELLESEKRICQMFGPLPGSRGDDMIRSIDREIARLTAFMESPE